MKIFILLFIGVIWGILYLIAQSLGLTDLSFEQLKNMIDLYPYAASILFVFLFSIRLVLFVPSSLFIVVGAIFFSPITNMFYALFSMFVTETIIYWIGTTFSDSMFHRYMQQKYPHLYEKLQKNRIPYLFTLVATPLAPTDATCFLAASLDIPYKSYISAVLLGNIPIILLYTVFGKLILLSPILVGVITIFILGIMWFLFKKYKHVFQ